VITILIAALLLTPGGFAVDLAPDQPVPHVYADDPVIVELRTRERFEGRLQVQVVPDHGVPFEFDLGRVQVPPSSSYWRVLEGVPEELDRYTVHIETDSGDASSNLTRVFCRIRRPGKPLIPAAGVNLDNASPKTLTALRAIPVNVVRVKAHDPNLELVIAKALAAGMQVVIALDASAFDEAKGGPPPEDSDETVPAAPDPAVAAASFLAARFRDEVGAWTIDPSGDAERFEAIAEVLQANGNKRRIELFVQDAEELEKLLAGGAGRWIEAAVFQAGESPHSQIKELRNVAEQWGYEGLPLCVCDGSVTEEQEGEGDAGGRLLRQVILNMAVGAARTDVDEAFLFRDDAFREAYVPLHGLSYRLAGTQPAGELELTKAVYAPVFRHGAEWIIAVSTDGEPQQVALDIGDARDLALTDLCSNPIRMDEAGRLEEGKWVLEVGKEPLYLSGRGGRVFFGAAIHSARQDAEAILALPDLDDCLAGELIDIIGAIAEATDKKPERSAFLQLLTTFPDLETRWHNGEISRSAAVPLIAGLSRLVQHLAVLEEEAQEPFLEPIEERLAKCSASRSEYLTSSGGAPNERGDWLMAEIGRLMGRVEALAEAGREIEAGALAALAEWRARSLAAASSAVALSEPEAVPEANDDVKQDETASSTKGR